MSAVAEVLSTVAPQPDPRGCDLPTCPVCADSMVAAEASAYVSDNVISYLWTCDTCGYGFVTKHAVKSGSPATELSRLSRRDVARAPSPARVARGTRRTCRCAIASRMPCIRRW